MMTEIYVSTDVETDGPIPGPHSMLSFASAAFTADGQMVDTFSRNLTLLPGALPHPDTQMFWARNVKAYDATRVDPVSPARSMREYNHWLKDLPGKPVFVAYPAGFDFMFIYWYLINFGGFSPFSHSALDIKTMAFTMFEAFDYEVKGYRRSTKRNMPKRWFGTRRHTHVALDDAIEQGELFCNMMKELRDDSQGNS